MPHPPIHRGLAPEDQQLFAEKQLLVLRSAMRDLCWLLDRGYAARSCIELVGNRHTLSTRQRHALSRCICSQEEEQSRFRRCAGPEELCGNELWIDGYNVLTVLESALSGGIVLIGRDGCCRDIAGIHKRYRKVNETIPALELVGNAAVEHGVTNCRWWLDKPVSNSGRLRSAILDLARERGWNMAVELTFNPDHMLSHTDEIIATSDGIVLERCQRWVNLARLIIEKCVPHVRMLDFSDCGKHPPGAEMF